MIEIGEDRSTLLGELRELRKRVAELEAEAAESQGRRFRQAEEVLRHLADYAPVMIWAADPSSGCTYFNKGWLTFRGRTLAQEAGNGWVDGLHPQDRDRCLATYLRAFGERRDFQMEYRLLRADGEYRWVVDSGVPRFGADGTFEGFVGSAVDITGQRPPEPAVPSPLTEREKQVLVLIAQGNSTKEAAALLGISYKTADSHRSKIMEKLDIHETASLVRYAIRHGFVTP